MFVLTTLVYPVVLALLCLGAGLLVDLTSGSRLAAMLLPAVGMAALIVLAQLTTYLAPIAPATPYVLAVVAITGFLLGRSRLRALAAVWRGCGWQLLVGPLTYVLALAPVLLSGRPTFSSYMTLADSVVHMLGADFLIHHGQDYSQLDLHNSYGAMIDAYYGASYPSGADTLFGGSSLLLRLPLIWTFQPFNAFALATATGPAWVLLQRMGLRGAWAAAATLTVTLSALVYAYELIGSIKEIVALPLILTMGALLVTHRRWLWQGVRGAIPFALVLAAGVAALGLAFGAWALAATIVLVLVAAAQITRGSQQPRRLAGLLALGAAVLLVAAWPTWVNLSGSLQVTQAIASTSNPGNLHSPLHPSQLLGVWLVGSYKLLPTGFALTLTSVSVALGLVLAIVGMGYVLRSGWYSLAGWFALTVFLWLLLNLYATTWTDAKALMLTSPVVLLMAWAGIAALRSSALRIAAPLVAFLLVGGVLVSDALQYHESNLAPTARYEELASIDTRFGGRGPTLFTDFDEYALVQLHDMDVGGPNFAFPPPALAAAVAGHGRPVMFERVAPAALAGYPLIVTRRDPTVARPPAAYRLLWQGSYYEVWGRRTAVAPALLHVELSSSSASQCSRVIQLAALARSHGTRLLAALAPEIVHVVLPHSRLKRPAGWVRTRAGILMRTPGTLRIAFRLPYDGTWELWLHGEVMRAIHVAVDGRPLGSLAAELDGNSLVTNPLTPLRARLSAGTHTLTITRPGVNLAPGDGGAALLAGIFLIPAGPSGEPTLRTVSSDRRRSLCGRPLQWAELVSTP
jgi:hypothetical protein